MSSKMILSKGLIFKIAYELRKQGKVVGLTFGAFDLFHVSHLDLLLKASKLCDYLIVGVDNNQLIKNYKGYTRPVIDVKNRVKIISELDCVDATFKKDEFKQDEIKELFKEIKPHYMFYGQNFGGEDAVVSPSQQVGVKIKKINTLQNETTTEIINRIIAYHKRGETENRINKFRI